MKNTPFVSDQSREGGARNGGIIYVTSMGHAATAADWRLAGEIRRRAKVSLKPALPPANINRAPAPGVDLVELIRSNVAIIRPDFTPPTGGAPAAMRAA